MPQGAGSGKAALSTVIRAACVTSPVSQSSPVTTMAIRFALTAPVHFNSSLSTLTLHDLKLAELIGAAKRKGLVAARK